jgi:hypothetical protein
MKHEFICSNCNQAKVYESNFSTGYGTNNIDEKVCFDCCGKKDAEDLKDLAPGKKTHLYMDIKKLTLSNWPGTLKIKVHRIKKGRHNIAGNRYDTWFWFAGNNYHAVQYGDNTQIAHTKKVIN